MNILDENIVESQREQLTKWRVPFRQIGYEVGRKGMEDEQIVPLLIALPRPTFFTQDWDYDKQSLCHPKYSLVIVDVKRAECAAFIRRVLKHSEFDTQAKRLGKVLHASHSGISVWRRHGEERLHFDWD